MGKMKKGNKLSLLIQPFPTPIPLNGESYFNAAESFGFVLVRKPDSLTDINILVDSQHQTAVIILSYSVHKNGNLGFTFSK